MRSARRIVVALGFALALGAGVARAAPLRVLVTNDDGVDAPGLDALVTALAANAQLEVTVVAPGTASPLEPGDQISNQPGATITSTAANTVGGTPATAIEGFPADAVLWAVLTQLPEPPELVVAGINAGQTLGESVRFSGNVGAALWAARFGIPAIAANVQFGVSDYLPAATFVARVVDHFRTNKGFRKRMREKGSTSHGIVLNMNFPDCPEGGRGMELVTVGRAVVYTGHTLLDDTGGVRTWSLERTTTNTNIVDCLSTLKDVTSDVDAFINGFATLTPLSDEGQVSSRAMKQFKLVTKLY